MRNPSPPPSPNHHHADESDFLPLKQLGLRDTAIACYEALYLREPLTVGNLAKFIKRPRTSVYHALSQLEQKGFVERDKNEVFHQVTRFRAVRLDKALENLAIYQRRAVRDLIDYQVKRSIERQASLRLPILRRDWR
jgi:predicted transcriptional regulator